MVLLSWVRKSIWPSAGLMGVLLVGGQRLASEPLAAGDAERVAPRWAVLEVAVRNREDP